MVLDNYFFHELLLARVPALWDDFADPLTHAARGITITLSLIFVIPWGFRDHYKRFKLHLLGRSFFGRNLFIKRKGTRVQEGKEAYLDLIDSLDFREHAVIPRCMPRTNLPSNHGYHDEMLPYFDAYGRKYHIGDYDRKQDPYPLSIFARLPSVLWILLYPPSVLYVAFRSLDIFCLLLSLLIAVLAGYNLAHSPPFNG